ncbi:Ig-like domain-containing protein [Hymenobacter sp. J193]|uniref:Ig-like domain-containing protein n=1 Tax=Hymenobacter sp. J193 TaxID=2898429 RepID=UPI002150C3F1|nr:Ig-like domain-containing protein [Hymenobacter sp. J193]MCR5889841.1 Ig-like domain-containing protein [Hymenobacter sp. J193]
MNVTTAGQYTVGFRVASANGGATLQLRNSAGTVLGSVNVGNTGGWQNWQTLSTNVSLPAGTQTLRLFASASTGTNVNWLTFSSVTTTNTPPTVSLTSPTSGATFTAPASITITANAADANGTVSKVEFYRGTTLLGTDTSAPYSYTWTGVAAGSYSITAKATDNQGAVTTSAAVSVTVTGSTGSCSVAAWTATGVYTVGQQASRSGNVYQAKWWTQGEDPLTASCTDCAWKLIGPCTSARTITAAATAKSDEAVKVYPNPVVSGELLTVELGATYEHVELVLLDLTGRRSHRASYEHARTITLRLPSLPNGVFLLQVQADGRTFTKRLSKQ